MRPWEADLIKRKEKCSIKEEQSGFCSCVDLAVQVALSTELKERRRRRQRELPKSNRFRLSKQQLCTCITLFCTFLGRRCTTTTWKCQISQFVEAANFDTRLLEFNSTKICQHLTNWTCWNKRDKVWGGANLRLFKWRFQVAVAVVL